MRVFLLYFIGFLTFLCPLSGEQASTKLLEANELFDATLFGESARLYKEILDAKMLLMTKSL